MTREQEQVKEQCQDFRQTFDRLRQEIAKVVVGHGDIVEDVLISLFCGGHVLLESVPGLGKTLLVRTLSDALSLEFRRIQFTPDLMPADIIGTNVIMEDPQDRSPHLHLSKGAGLWTDDPGRRDQPGHTQDPVRHARGHAGTLGHQRRDHARLA